MKWKIGMIKIPLGIYSDKKANSYFKMIHSSIIENYNEFYS